MTKPNNDQKQEAPRLQTKAEVIAQREQVRMLGIALGNWREAARQCGLSEGRVLNWVVRYGWKLPKRIEAPHPREVLTTVRVPPDRDEPAQVSPDRASGVTFGYQRGPATNQANVRGAAASCAFRDGLPVLHDLHGVPISSERLIQ